ncbi:MAG: stage II sporulation protein M [Chloroflexi bacterium]|nr:MAG: stage II sporulation protein M [Chloroflexota bacterium]
MTPESFAATRQESWRELEACVRSARRGSLRRLAASDIERFALLYRRASSDLAIALRDFPGQGVTEYLNALCARAHPLLYRGAPMRLWSLGGFFATGLPRAVRGAAPYMLASAAFLLVGALAGWITIAHRPDLGDALLPAGFSNRLNREGVHASIQAAPLLASFIIQNNVRVALVCFAGGILLGIPTAAILFLNGWTLGMLGAAVHAGGDDGAFWALIVPHGVLELSVIVIAGGTGLMIGDAILRPGLRRRSDALVEAARTAAVIASGIAALLIIAGCIEAFVTPSAMPDVGKYAVAVGTGVLLYSWLLLSGRKPRPRARLRLDASERLPAGS